MLVDDYWCLVEGCKSLLVWMGVCTCVPLSSLSVTDKNHPNTHTTLTRTPIHIHLHAERHTLSGNDLWAPQMLDLFLKRSVLVGLFSRRGLAIQGAPKYVFEGSFAKNVVKGSFGKEASHLREPTDRYQPMTSSRYSRVSRIYRPWGFLPFSRHPIILDFFFAVSRSSVATLFPKYRLRSDSMGSFVSDYMYVYVCTCTYIYTYMYIYIYIHIHTYIYICTYICILHL